MNDVIIIIIVIIIDININNTSVLYVLALNWTDK